MKFVEPLKFYAALIAFMVLVTIIGIYVGP